MKQEQPTPTRRQAIKASLTTTGYAALKTAEYASLGAALGAVGVVGVGMYQQKRNFDLAQKLHQEMISAENDKYWQEYNETLGMHINHVAEYNPQLHQTEYFYDVVDTPIISVDAFERVHCELLYIFS